MNTPTPWYKTATFYFTIAALLVTGLLSQKVFANDSVGEKLLFVANFVLGGLGFSASRTDVKKAWDLSPPEK